MCISAQSHRFLQNCAENAAKNKLCNHALESHFVRIMLWDCAAHKTEVLTHYSTTTLLKTIAIGYW